MGVSGDVILQATVTVAAERVIAGCFRPPQHGNLLRSQGSCAFGQLQQDHVVVVLGEAARDRRAPRLFLATARLRKVHAHFHAVCLTGMHP
jgi:hypothetical protein